MSVFPVKVWVDSDVYDGNATKDASGFVHLHEKTYFVEARGEAAAKEKALEVYMKEEAMKHIHAHAEEPIYVEQTEVD